MGENKIESEITDILLSIGIPASVKGFTYICDAIVLFDTDPYFENGKICVLYHEIARKRRTTASRVERAMRHAFESAIHKGDREKVEYYLDLVNTQNSNLLRTLYIRMKQKMYHLEEKGNSYVPEEWKRQMYKEMMTWFSHQLNHFLDLREGQERGEHMMHQNAFERHRFH